MKLSPDGLVSTPSVHPVAEVRVPPCKGARSFSWPGALVVLSIFISLVSCARVPPRSGAEGSHVILGVPFHPQEEFQCGPASLAGVLNYWNVAVSPEEIASEIYSPSVKGTLTIDMALYAEKRGLRARQYRGSIDDIRKNIDSGFPLIVLIDKGVLAYQSNHFMVVIGYDGKGVIVHSGREALQRIPYRSFLKTWKRANFWTLLVTPQ